MNINLIDIIDKNGEDIKNLLINERNSNVLFKNNCYFITSSKKQNWRPVSGLLPVLKKCFWSSIDHKLLALGKDKVLGSKGKTGGGGIFVGSIRGTIIHEQIHDYILFDEPNFLKKHTHLHPWAKKIFQLIHENGWIPVISEFDVYDASLRMATSVDIICVAKKTGKVICLEIKTGYRGYFQNSHGYMSGSLRKMPLSILNCASIQLMASMLIIIKYHAITNIEGWVIHVNDSELDMFLIKNEFIKKYGNSIYKDIYQHRRQIFIEKDNRNKNKYTRSPMVRIKNKPLYK